jgi:hypothetical protein
MPLYGRFAPGKWLQSNQPPTRITGVFNFRVPFLLFVNVTLSGLFLFFLYLMLLKHLNLSACQSQPCLTFSHSNTFSSATFFKGNSGLRNDIFLRCVRTCLFKTFLKPIFCFFWVLLFLFECGFFDVFAIIYILHT